MIIQIELASPTDEACQNPKFTSLPSGTVLHRIHRSKFGGVEFCPVKTNFRFSSFENDRGVLIPALYAGENFETAICEVILRFDNVGDGGLRVAQPRDFADRCHSEIILTRDLSLVDLRGQGQRALGISENALTAGDSHSYHISQEWAQTLHRLHPDQDGLLYTSIQNSPCFAIMIFGDRASDAVSERETRSVADDPVKAKIRTVANNFNASYIDLL